MKFISQVALEKDLKQNIMESVKNRREFCMKKFKSILNQVHANVSLSI